MLVFRTLWNRISTALGKSGAERKCTIKKTDGQNFSSARRWARYYGVRRRQRCARPGSDARRSTPGVGATALRFYLFFPAVTLARGWAGLGPGIILAVALVKHSQRIWFFFYRANLTRSTSLPASTPLRSFAFCRRHLADVGAIQGNYEVRGFSGSRLDL